MRRIDLNARFGRKLGAYTLGDDAALLQCVTSANIACGFHAGDPGTMAPHGGLAAAAGVALGAHPGLPDLAGIWAAADGPLAAGSAELGDVPNRRTGGLCGAGRAGASACQAARGIVRNGGRRPGSRRSDSPGCAGLAGAADLGRAVRRQADCRRPNIRAGNCFGDFCRPGLPSRRHSCPRFHPSAVLHDLDAVAARITLWVREGIVLASDGSPLTLERTQSACTGTRRTPRHGRRGFGKRWKPKGWQCCRWAAYDAGRYNPAAASRV